MSRLKDQDDQNLVIQEMREDSPRKKKEGGIISLILIAGAIALFFRSFVFVPYHVPTPSMYPNIKNVESVFVSKMSYGYNKYSFPLGRFLPFNFAWLQRPPEAGDVAVFFQTEKPGVFNANGKAYVKRIIAEPGDRFAMKDGVVIINGKPLKTEFIRKEVLDYIPGSNSVEAFVYRETLPSGESYEIYRMLDLDDAPYVRNARWRQLNNIEEFTLSEEEYMCLGDNRDNSEDCRINGPIQSEVLIGQAKFIFLSVNTVNHRFWNLFKWPETLRLNRFFTPL